MAGKAAAISGSMYWTIALAHWCSTNWVRSLGARSEARSRLREPPHCCSMAATASGLGWVKCTPMAPSMRRAKLTLSS